MSVLRPLIATGTLLSVLAACGSSALAADVSRLPPPLPPPTYVPPPQPIIVAPNVFMAGLYLRGDAGMRWGMLKNADASAPFADPRDNDIGNAASYGGGIGMRSGWFRSDITVDYGTRQNYQGTVLTPDDVRAKIQSTTGLFNVYADLGTWWLLTPYIGAGIGAARTTVSDFESAVTPPFTGAPGNSQWSLAWAANAGVAITVAPNLQIDFGYRYLNIGDIETGDGAPGRLTFKNVASHEARVGLRFNFDDLPGSKW